MVLQDFVREALLPAEEFRKGFIEAGHLNWVIWYVGFQHGGPGDWERRSGCSIQREKHEHIRGDERIRHCGNRSLRH